MKHTKTLSLVQLALLVALELVLTYTPLGYLSVPGLTITFLMVPVSLGAMVLGPVAGAVLGGVFGLTSFAQCFGASPFGAALLGIQPVLTFVVCFFPRVLAGLLPALVFQAVQRKKPNTRNSLLFGGCALLGSVLNTVLFMGALLLCFYNTPYILSMAQGMGATNPIVFAALFVGVQGIIEAVVCCILAGLLGRVLYPLVHRSRLN